MHFLVEIILIILLVRAIGKFFFVCQLHRLKLQPNSSNLNEGKQIFLLLKVLEEENNITNAVEHMDQIIKNNPNFCGIIVGSVKERINDVNPTLIKAHRRVNELSSSIKIVEAPLTVTANAAGQLNFSISYIKSNENIWILLLDIDTRISQDALEEIIYYVNQGSQVIQLSAHFLLNFEAQSFLQKGHSLLQSRWTISHEMLRLRLYHLTRLVLTHVVGHGLCINLEYLKSIGKFPEETFVEDIHLGFNIACSGVSIVSCSHFDESDAPTTLLDGLKQEFSWSFAAMLYPAYFRTWLCTPSHSIGMRAKACWLCVQGVLLYLNWQLVSWFMFGAIVLIWTGHHLACAFVLVYFLEYLTCVMLFIRLNKITSRDAVVGILALPFAILRRSLPANVAFLYSLVTGSVRRFKTPHK